MIVTIILVLAAIALALACALLKRSGPKITLCVAYTRTGKDTLYTDVTKHGAHVVDVGDDANEEYKEVRWFVYARDKALPPELPHDMVRVGFADLLKEDACKSLGLTEQWRAYEPVKDTMMVTDPETGERITLRQYYIVFGQRAKVTYGEDVWARQGFAPWSATSNHLFACDARFWVEVVTAIKYADKPTTIRLFRSKVPVPPKRAEYDSEHTLDLLHTDYLFVAEPEEDFAKAVELWPHYKDYVCKWKIVI